MHDSISSALFSGDLIGGHLVSGHIDGIGTIVRRTPINRDWQLDIACENSILRHILPKGSIACDGVSLTVAKLGKTFFSVYLVPYTWQNTALFALREGDPVNLETDLIGKYVFRWLEEGRAKPAKDPDTRLTEDILRQAGFIE